MPWCPECKTEYCEGYSICDGCHVPLVDELPDLPEVVPEPEPEWPPVDLGEPVLLITLDNIVEAKMLMAFLREQQIPIQVKGNNRGGYLGTSMGANGFNTEIYVPQQLLTLAQEMLETIHPPQGLLELPVAEEDAIDAEDIEDAPFLHDLGWVLLWLLLIGCVFGLLSKMSWI